MLASLHRFASRPRSASKTWLGLGLMLSLLLLQACAGNAIKTAATPTAPVAAQAISAGDLAYQRGDYDDALVEYVKAVTAEPRNSLALNRIALTHTQLGDLDIAADAYRRALAIAPDNAEAHEGYGLILLRQQQTAAARQSLNLAVQRDPARWRAYNGLGVIADLSGDFTSAEAQYQRAAALSPHNGEVLNNLGYSRYLAGRLDEAQGYFKQALDSAPDNRKAWSNLALVYARRGRYAEAVAAFGELMPEPQAYYSAGYICMLDHRYADAERLLRKAIQLSPSYYTAAQRSLDRVQLQASLDTHADRQAKP